MTKKEFYTAVATLEIEELAAHAKTELEKMEAEAEKRRNQVSKKALENQPLVDHIVENILCGEPVTATDVSGVMEITVQKASALLRTAVKQGKANQVEIKIPKRGNQKGYLKA